MLNFRAIKIFRGTTQPGYVGIIRRNYHKSSDCLNTQQNPYLNQATQKSTCQTFPTQKNPEIKNFKPQKIVRLSLSLEIQSTSPGSWGSCLWQNMRIILPLAVSDSQLRVLSFFQRNQALFVLIIIIIILGTCLSLYLIIYLGC